MEPTKNLSDFSSSNTQSSGGSTGLSLANFLDEPKAKTGPVDLAGAIAQEGAEHIKPLIEAFYKQESGSGKNAGTSVDGAKGGMQVIPATFSRYAKPGESIDNPADNVRVGVRILKDLASKFGNDPAKIATGYFSGDGNVNQGSGQAWKEDRADGNGMRVSKYVSGILDKLGVTPKAQASAAPDITKAPKWSDIEGKPEFKALNDEQKAAAKQSYFDYWIAPHAGTKGDELRKQFMQPKESEHGLLGGVLAAAKSGVGSVIDALTPDTQSLESPYKGERPANPDATLVPVSKETRAGFNSTWDAATPEQRKAMAEQPGWVGQLARERNSMYAQPGTQIGKRFDPRVESRRDTLIANGEDARFADTAARMGAQRGVVPGQEVASMATAKESGFDFDTKQAFQSGQTNGLNNPLVRGLAKGGLGFSKAITGYGEFLADTYGLDEAKKIVQSGSQWARGKEQAIGEAGTTLDRNFEGAISSIAQQLPLIVGGIRAGSEAVPLAGMALQSFGQEYSDGRAAGQDVAQATTRAAIFAAFEVIGEKFGLRASMQAIKGAAHGMASDKLLGFLGEALKKEIPGELLTTTGQFATDKFAPGGVGLNPNATLDDYLQQVADTVIQTVMQGGVMAGGTTGVSAAVRHLQDNGQTQASAAADANLAQQQAMSKWATTGLGQSTSDPAGRVDPVGVPDSVHPSVTDAEQIVRELAADAGIPEETVLPTKVTPQPAPVVQDIAPMPADTGAETEAVSDQDVLNLANSRYQQLREKRDGATNVVAGEDGLVEQHGLGAGLSERERAEMAALEASRGDVGALRKFYGLDQQVEDLAEREARLEREAMQADDTPTPIPQNQDDDIPGFDSPANQEVLTNGPQATQAQQTEPAKEVRAQEQDQSTDRGTEARQEPSVSATGSPSLEADGLNQPQAPAKPKTEKEAKQRKAIERIAKGSAYFGSQEKAKDFITKNGIGDTHEAKKGKAGRWDIVAKENGSDTRTQAVYEASKAAAKAIENGGTDADAMRAATDSLIESMDDAPGISVSQDAPAALEAAKQSKQDAPGTRYATDADRAGAERLEKLLEVFHAERNTPAGQARSDIRSVIEELRKPKTATSVEAVLQAAAQKLDRKHGPQADVVREVLEQIDQREAKDSQGGSQGEQAGGSRPTPGADAKKEEQASGAAPAIAQQEPVDSLHNPGKPDPKNSAAMDELEGFKPGDTVDVDGRTIGRSTVELVYRRQMAGLGAIPMARVVGANGKKLDVLLSELTRTEQKPEAPAQADPVQEKQVSAAAADDFDAMFDDVLAEELAKDNAKKAAKPKTEKEAKAKRAAAAVREMTEEGRAKDGKPINGGDVFRTLSGRITTPYPKQKGERYASEWLIENAKAEAQARGDDFNATGFGAVKTLKGGNLTGSDRDSMLMYLFGEQPAVVPSILKPLTSAGKNSAAALTNAIDGLGALFGGAGKLSSGFTFDEETYAKAKPLFQAAVANLEDAGKDLREAMRAVVRLVLDKFGAQAAQNMKPYAVRFIEDFSQDAGKGQEKSTEADVAVDEFYTPEGKFKVAKALADHFIGGGTFDTIVSARKMIGDIIGRKIEPATELAKQADETVEVAVVLAAREMVEAGRKQGRSAQVIYDRLLSLFKAQPNLAVRSSTSMRDQAYSTPVPLAYVASQLAGVTPDTKMIESTAGNGMLAIGASTKNATVNELNPKRAAMLKAMGFNVTTENAATATLAPARSMDAVVINPPFGATKDANGNTIVYEVKPDYGTREVDHAIVFKTLEAMKDDGKAVLIVGGVMSETEDARREDYRGKNKRTFYFNLYRDYNVVDHFTMDGALYAKQGASYPVDVIVINGRGQSERNLPAADLPHIIKSYEELKEKLNAESSLGTRGDVGADVADGRSGGARNADDAADLAGRAGNTGKPDGESGAKPEAGSAAGVRGSGGGRVNGQSESGRSVSPGQQLEPQGVAGQRGDGQGAVRGEGAGKRGREGSSGNERLPALGGPGVVSGKRIQSGLTDRRGEEQETETQVAYTPHSNATSVGTLVPRAMKDAIEGSLQRIADEVGDLDQYVADSLAMDPETLRSNFSAEQVDALALSIRNAEAGKGFIIGDQTGIGKGRVVAAMIRYAIINDKTPVFVTEKPNLYSDMIRDLDDIGMTDDLGLDTKNPRIFITNSDETIPYTLLRTEGDEVVENNLTLKPAKRGASLNDVMQKMMDGDSLGDYKVIFTTYSQLQTVKGTETTRQKFVKHFGAANYMIFDESHNAGGAGETQARTKEQRKAEKAGESLVTGRAAFVRSLVSSAFGTFFSSATYAKRPDVMDLYSSTNMRLAVDNISQLGSAIKEGGVPMQQVVANMLTKDGQYIRRERTFAGVSYDTVPTGVDKKTAENMASAMRSILAFSRKKDVLLAQMQKEADKQGAMLSAVGGANTSIEGANFGAIMHNLIDQMLLALKVESSVKHAIERLKAGEKVVLTVSNTMGSFLKEYADEMGLNSGDVVGLSFGDLYVRYLEKQRVIRIKDGGGKVTVKRLSDAELGPELTKMFNDIEAQIRKSGFGSAPISPIDYMHTELRKAGFSTDEITGRTMTLNYVDGTPTLASRTANIKQRVNAVRGFNNGNVDVLILNQAGSTGLSLHAAAKFKDKRKRHMIIVQAEKNIDTHMQMLGRVHRTGQVVTPSYSQMMADIPAELRPAAVLLKKMASLNANTTASRKSAVTADGVVDFMNDYGGQVVHEFLRDNPDVHSALGGSKVIKLTDESEDATEDDIRKLTGYIPILPIAEQERIYADLIQRYNELIERENSLGTNKLEAKALDLDAETTRVAPLTEQKEDQSIFAAPANMELVDVKRTVKPFTSDEVRSAIKERLAGRTGAMVASEMVKSLRERGQAFIDERMKKAEASENADAVRLADQRMLLNMNLQRAASILDTFSIGDQISVADKQTGVLYGVITDIASSGRTANPAAGSDWKMTIALANGDAKSITINFSQIGNRYQIKQERIVNWYNAETQKGEEMRVIDIFDKGVSVRREKRWIVTGNILAGFSKFKGQIISYTKKDGTIAQGVLMSRQFDFDKEMRSVKVGMRNVPAALAFFKEAGLNSTIGTEDGNFKIIAGRGQFSAVAQAAKRLGGAYYLDNGLTEMIGADFYKKGTNMVARIPEYRIQDVLDYLINSRGESLVALTHNDVARKLAGLDKTQEAGKESAPGGIKFNAKDNHESQSHEAIGLQRTERSARNIRELLSGVVEYLRGDGQTVDDNIRPYVAVDVRGASEIDAIAKTFGLDIQWFDLAEGLTPEQRRQFGRFNGAYYKKKVFLRANGVDRPHLAILGHEVAHELRRSAPDLYDEFVDAVNKYIKPGEYKKFLTLEVANKADAPREEFSGEVLSDLFMERDFWQHIGEQSPTLLGRLAEIVTRLVDKLMHAVGYTKRSAPYVTDYRKVMEIATDIMVRYKGRKVDAGAGIKFAAKATGFDGIAYFHKDHNATEYVAFEPGQIKSAIGNNGEFDPDSEEIHFNMQDGAKRTSKLMEFARKAQNDLIHFFGNQDLKTFNWYDKTIASQYHKALKDKHFGKVYSLLLGMQNHVAMAAVRAAQLAPGVLPRVDDMKTAAKEIFSVKNNEAMAKASKAIFAGTLHGENVLEGKVWTDDELRNQFGMDDAAVGLYRQARAAINASIDEVAAAEAYAMAHKIVSKDMRAKVIASPNDAPVLLREEIDNQIKALRLSVAAAKNAEDKQAQAELTATLDSYKKTLTQVEKIFTKALNLKLAGYAPLMRFGNFTVEVQHVDPITGAVERDEDGKPMTIFFGRYETQREANKARSTLEARFKDRDDVRVSAGTYNPDKHQLYVGVTPETLELFADAVGAGRAVDEYIRLTRSDRSALKRQLERAGTPGFSDDLSRVVSNFITSNARHSAQQFYMNAINNAVKYIPKEKGDVQQEAQKLRAFVLDSKDAGAVGSSLMFAWFLGGSVAAAAVNATQPLMVTMPYLSQYVSPAKASAALTKAGPRALGKAEIADKDLKEALHKASLEGIVDAQEIFHLYSLGSRQLALGTKSQAALTLWGSMFSAVEGLNRRLTFIAAWDIAKANGMQNPYAFAVRAVNSTQGIYNKVNRPNLARSAVGRLMFTYKGYALMVTELMARMWKAGPEGKKAVAIMLAMLVLASGEEGLPGAKALDDIIDSIGQLMGYDTNMRRFKRRHAYEILGKAFGDAFLYGASSHMPLDFGGRLGLGSMIPGTDLLKISSANQKGKAIGEIVGPSAGMAQQVGDAIEAAGEGNLGQAMQNLAPKAVKDVLAAASMATKGYSTDAVGRKVVDVGLSDAAVKAVGFQPTVIAQEHRKTMPIQQDIALQQKTEASIVANWAQGIVNKDENMVDQARAKMEKWNKDNPDSAIAISQSQIKSRVKMLVSDKENRTLHKAPKEMRGRVGLDLADD